MPETKWRFAAFSAAFRSFAECAAETVSSRGVAFDVSGGRLGHGRGYYDRLLADVRPDAPLVALAFECQLFPPIPMGTHDVYMDLVVTEKEIYRGRGRSFVSR